MSVPTPRRVLVVEDDMVTQCLLSGLLDSWGYEVHTASNGREGMAVLRCVGADVVITDIIMPEQDGFATIALLRRDFPDVKVIAISGGAAALDMESAIRTAHVIGADFVLPKPLNTVSLEKALAAFDDMAAPAHGIA
ncbi:MAG TPA: response regulator [Desulfovibrio sp.]|uniref:Chemotaxis protein CheY, putative n=1 Tax=Nitratidesulfovibrio vulgaris (strain ATCC 29579 / DSM 644 / CCUG 34227 / NCIMB 8303 / VKM B-1760 / Hildenborough) TaxID=882 RepID=Q72DX3_NITV2|nr:chemotaxis protein CheY, putative [Nitratidesulfovibrio vulgaris str. Hildenborough]HBW14821.1 response regulator [Desulfovibrio sp.]